MTAKRAVKKPAPTTLDGDQVAAYLLAHPEFFEEHPRLLESLRVPHPSGAAVSLIERQVEHLRAELQQAHKKLVHLVSLAKDNDSVAARMHRLTLSLVVGKDFEQLQSALKTHLRDEFGADAVRFLLFPAEQPNPQGPSEGAQAERIDPQVTAFLEFLGAGRPVCGPLHAEQLHTLFPEEAERVRSAALIPVDAGPVLGILAIGSEDAERFRPAMATDFLRQLGEIIGHKLRAIPLPGV